ncbi:hypothetical protein J2X11_002380 [Aeromicrobium panaciterrae]|uniref:DUF3618 domain-containing protein n=1 Tax=Aeromicrobium panaciterrae TaxID=363861 RepID=A0ABU1UQU0_9ACTN|nr:DUF3618 domain-containing protein [Aeromicrobium panaciterrae]MDR7087541.1 hypothetical protein [Aeromicrobium panaciterrae]
MAKADSDELVSEIEQIRDRLADTVDALIDRAHPSTIARRSLASIKGRFVEPDGTPKVAVLAPVLGGIAAIVAVIAFLRRLLR